MRCEIPWSASSGATISARTSARPMANAASQARPGRLRSDDAVRGLLRYDVLEGRPREYSEDGVVQDQEQEKPLAVRRYCSADAADDKRDRERKDEKRKEELASPPCCGHRGHQRADGTDPDIREENAGERGPVERLEAEHERRKRHRLCREQEYERRECLPEPDCAPVAGGEDETVENVVLLLRHPGARESEERGEHDRDPEESIGSGLAGVLGEREVKDDQRREDEEQHCRERVAPPELHAQVLVRQRGDVGEVRHASASLCVASASRRAGSCVATTSVRSPRSASSSRSRSRAPSSSRAEYGSSRTSTSGS